MDAAQAQRVIESLRTGIPPDGLVGHFTVGRESEIRQLTDRLDSNKAGGLLLQANYGSGKTHLLRFIREEAIRRNYAVSVVTLDCRSQVRFNRMDQMLGAICRNIEVRNTHGSKGIRSFLDFIARCMTEQGEMAFWSDLSNSGKWDYSTTLESPAMFVALRAWMTRRLEAKDKTEDWLQQPWNYKTQRKVLYSELIENLRFCFRDPRQSWQFYADEVFAFDKQGYAQSWAAVRDLNTLSRAAGLRGLIVLFDEFEDVITNMGNIRYKESAFWNLFQFCFEKQFSCMSFYAVTPEFIHKCKSQFQYRNNYADYDFSRFEQLPTFEMSPLEMPELRELAMRILVAHGLAYNWKPDSAMKASDLERIVTHAAFTRVQDRTRNAIISVVKALDHLLQDGQESIDSMLAEMKETLLDEITPIPDTPQVVEEFASEDIRRFKKATGCYESEGFVVFKGSSASDSTAPSFDKIGSARLRNRLIQKGVLTRNGDEYTFTQDYVFRSPSAAAYIVAGYKISGPKAWGRK